MSPAVDRHVAFLRLSQLDVAQRLLVEGRLPAEVHRGPAVATHRSESSISDDGGVAVQTGHRAR